ncbi:MAG TPA: DUF6249 domain-containing protein [Chthoniobacterales bacterium]|nr:DUF6249 domain-containing protein [Chthoniobacterales bacterium]
MKTTFLICFCSIALALNAFGQTPTPVMSPSSQSTVSATTAASPATVAATPDPEESIEAEVARKLKRKFGITIDRGDRKTRIDRHGDIDVDVDDDDFGAFMAIPIIGIVFSTLFGAPVMIVAAIMFFSYLKSRSLHRTVRSMVEKGQEVPAALFAAPPVVRARSDMRRGVVLLMVGFGLMVFFGAVNDWEGGAWSLGIIPFLIGLGYLLVWKMEGGKDKAPPLP